MAVNPWLQEKLKKVNSPKSLGLIVEVADKSKLAQVRSQVKVIPGVSVGTSAFNMFRVEAPKVAIDTLSQIPGVTVHYDAPKGIRNSVSMIDPLIGKFSISKVEIPYTPSEMLARFGPTVFNRFRVVPSFIYGKLPGPLRKLGSPTGPTNPDVIIVTTGETRKWLQVPEENTTKKTRVCVLDTGIGFPDPFLLHTTKGNMYMDSTIEQPNPLDGLGHGHWCITCAFGDSYNTRFGLCRGVCDPEDGTLGSIKCLSTLGFGSSWSVITAMEKAYKWGARVVSMSLGGELQGSVDDDPECQIIQQLKDEVIFVVAAGNEGPSSWTVGSPGASPFAVTVGAWSTYYDGLAIFSSRGPNSGWYRDHDSEWSVDYRKYGQDLIKPDIVAPGGGPVRNGDKPDMIYSGVRGWCDGMNDLTPGDGFDAMRGTSMATPHAAGLIALAVDRGYVRTAHDVKAKVSRGGTSKSSEMGYGMITWSKLAS